METAELGFNDPHQDTEMAGTYQRLRYKWSKDLSLELLRMYRSINYLREDYVKLRLEMEHLVTRLDRVEGELALEAELTTRRTKS